MQYIVIGLGNPGEEYENTRHNTGRIVLERIAQEYVARIPPLKKGVPEGRGIFHGFSFDKKSNALVAQGKIGKEKVSFVAPETFMNKSGQTVAKLVKGAKATERLIVIYDDFSLPLGRMKISFNRSSGGHNGLGSIIKALKTEAFARIRIGIAPENSKGNAKLLHGDDKIIKFILGEYKPDELKILKKVAKKVAEAVETTIKESREKAMSVYNAG